MTAIIAFIMAVAALIWYFLTGIQNQLVADISANSPHHFLVFCHIFASFWRKIKVDSVLESGESRASI
jgi:hypothetical protein